MRILHIIPNYPPGVFARGVTGPMYALNKELVKMGVEVTVYTTNLDGKKILNVPLNQEVVLDGVKVYYFPITYKSWYYSAALHGALIHNLKNFDLIHISSVFLSVSTLGAYYAKKFNKPYIISPHGSLMQEPLQYHALKKEIQVNLIEKRNLAGAVAIHFTTEKESEEYMAADFPIKKAFVVPYCFDIEEFEKDDMSHGIFRKRFNIGQNKKIVLFLSRISWKKGLDTLIPAFAEVLKKEPEAILVIAGPDDENYKKEVILQIENCKLKIGRDVIFTGILLGEDRISAYRNADVFILPSYSENFGMVIVEALAFCLPVVITKGIGISKKIKKAGAGFMVEKEINQVAEAVLRILNNPDLAKKMGEQGRELVKREFSCDKIAERFIEEYQEVVNNYRK